MKIQSTLKDVMDMQNLAKLDEEVKHLMYIEKSVLETINVEHTGEITKEELYDGFHTYFEFLHPVEFDDDNFEIKDPKTMFNHIGEEDAWTELIRIGDKRIIYVISFMNGGARLALYTYYK